MNFTKLTDNIYYGSVPSPKILNLNQFKTFLNLTDTDIDSILNPSQTLVNIPLQNRIVLSNQEIINVMEKVSELPQPIYIFCNNGHGRSGVIAALLFGMTYCLKGAPTIEYVQQQWQKYRGSSIDDPELLRLGSPQGKDNKFAVENFLDYYYYKCLKVQDMNRLPGKSFLVYKGHRINTILFYTHNKGIVKKEKDTKKVIFDEKKEVNRKYESFSNYTEESFSVPSDPNGILNWRASENYYQSLKYTSSTAGDQEMIKKIRFFMSTSTPHQAYLLGRFGAKGFGSYMANNKHENVEKTREMIAWMKKYAIGKVRVREDWEKYKVYAMSQTLLYKSSTKDFEMPSEKDSQNGFKNCQNPKFVKLLYEIPDNTLIVEHTSRDRIWGDGGDGGLSLVGTNYLGKILTSISFVMKHGSCKSMDPYLKDLVYIHGAKKKTKIEKVDENIIPEKLKQLDDIEIVPSTPESFGPYSNLLNGTENTFVAWADVPPTQQSILYKKLLEFAGVKTRKWSWDDGKVLANLYKSFTLGSYTWKLVSPTQLNTTHSSGWSTNVDLTNVQVIKTNEVSNNDVNNYLTWQLKSREKVGNNIAIRGPVSYQYKIVGNNLIENPPPLVFTRYDLGLLA